MNFANLYRGFGMAQGFQHYEDLADVVTRHMQQLPTITKTHTLMAFQCYSRDDLQQAWDIGVE